MNTDNYPWMTFFMFLLDFRMEAIKIISNTFILSRIQYI